MNVLLVALGSALGGVTRWLAGGALQRRFAPVGGASMPFPFGTLIVNVTGSFILGALAVYLTRQGERAESVRLLLAVGFCGGYTTFSTFSLDTVTLLEEGSMRLAMLNMAASLGLALLGTFGGIMLMRAVLARPA